MPGAGRVFSRPEMPEPPTPADPELTAEQLSEEIRRAIPDRPGGEEPGRRAALTRAWGDAERFVVPSVEPGVAFYRLKRLLLRGLRLVTRSQGTFNARVLQGARDLERAILRLSEERSKEIEQLRRQLDLLHARLSAASSETAPPARRDGLVAAPGAGLPEGFYVRFEEELRGPEASIRERQRAYVDFFRAAGGEVLDCGCGRGEFLEVLRAAGIPAEGVDTNGVALELARAKGLTVGKEDVFDRLRRCDGALGGVSALQLVEHFEPEAVFGFLRLAFRALRPGGRLLVETINPDSLYALRAYRLDPTHRWPVPPPTLELMAREAGFADREIRYFSPVPDGERLAESTENDRKLNRWIFGPQDYALFAHHPGTGA